MMNVMKYGWVASGAIAIAMAFVATSCEDDFGKGGNNDDGTIRLEVTDDNIFVIGSDSRADEATAMVVESDPIRYFSEIVGQDTIPMSVTESHNSSSRLMGCYAEGTAPDSRGEYYSTGKITEFHGEAYTESGSKLFFKENFNVDGSNIVNTGRFWPADGVALNFYGYKKSNDNGSMTTPTIDNDAKKITFSYTMPDAAAADASGDFHDAEKQPDLVFAIVPSKTKTTGNVEMPFHHALTAITFKVGTMPADTKVKSVAITDCYTSGKCVATSASPSDVSFAWSERTGNAKYVQSFNQDATLGAQLGEAQHTFLLIPQEYGTGATSKLVITFQIKEYGDDTKNSYHTYTMEKPMSEIIPAGVAADHRYYFTIGIDKGEVGIDVDDEVDGKVKKNVSIKNIGIAEGYVRAAIVGYWLRTEDIMIPWSVTDTSVGTLKKAANWDDYWKEGDDGYFYYKKVLGRGQETECKLFETYEVTAGAPPVEGAVLEINVVAQIVHKNYWPSEWPSQSSLGVATP